MATKVSRVAVARTVVGKLIAEPDRRSEIMRQLAAFLSEHGMTGEANMIINDIANELYAQTGTLPVTVTTASPLSDQSRAELVRYLKDATGAKAVDLYETIDTGLIGGLVAQTPSAELDVSISSKLKQLATLA